MSMNPGQLYLVKQAIDALATELDSVPGTESITMLLDTQRLLQDAVQHRLAEQKAEESFALACAVAKLLAYSHAHGFTLANELLNILPDDCA